MAGDSSPGRSRPRNKQRCVRPQAAALPVRIQRDVLAGETFAGSAIAAIGPIRGLHRHWRRSAMPAPQVLGRTKTLLELDVLVARPARGRP